MIYADNIKNTVEKILENSSSFLIDVVVKPGNIINIFIDSDKGIVIDDCIALSQQLEEILNKGSEDFELNVSSSGADAPVSQIRQMKKAVEKEFEVLRHDNTKFKAILKELKPESFVLEWSEKVAVEGKKGKKLQTFTKEFSLSDIKQIKRTISFK